MGYFSYQLVIAGFLNHQQYDNIFRSFVVLTVVCFLTVHFRRCSIWIQAVGNAWFPPALCFQTTQNICGARKNKWKHAPSKNTWLFFVAVFGGISFLQVCQLVVHRGALCVSVFGGHEGWLGGRILDNKGSLKCWRNPNPWPERLKKVTWGWIQSKIFSWVVVSKIFYFHPYLGRWSNLTNIFQMGWNRQLETYSEMYCD